MFYSCMKKCPPRLNIVSTLPCEIKHRISYFYNALLEQQLMHQA